MRTKYQKTTQHFNYHIFTDVHFMDWGCDEEKFDRDLRRAANDPVGFIVFNGDNITAINPKDKRFQASNVHPDMRGLDNIAQEEADAFFEKIKHVADKIIAFGLGNHEDSVRIFGGYDPYREVATRLALLRGDSVADFTYGYEGFVKHTFTRSRQGWTFKVRLHHGYGGAGVGLPGNPALKLGREADSFEAHLIVLGHLHQKSAVSKAYTGLSRKGGAVHNERKAFMVPGYQRHYKGEPDERDKRGFPITSWGQKRGHRVNPTGNLIVQIHPHDMEFYGLF